MELLAFLVLPAVTFSSDRQEEGATNSKTSVTINKARGHVKKFIDRSRFIFFHDRVSHSHASALALFEISMIEISGFGGEPPLSMN